MSNSLAPRPARSNWGRVIYNVLHDNGNKAITKEKIWALVPDSMHTPHSKGKFTATLSRMCYGGYLASYNQVGTSAKTYRIALGEGYENRRKELVARQAGYDAKHRAKKLAKKAKKTRRIKALREATPANGLLANVDAELAKVNDDLEVLYARKARLRDIRKEAAKL